MNSRFLPIVLFVLTTPAGAFAQEQTSTRPKIEFLATGQGVHIDRARVEREAAEALSRLDLERLRFEADYRKRKQDILQKKVEELVGDRLLEIEAFARRTSKEELIKEVTESASDPTEEEIDRLWEANKNRFQDQTREEIAPQIEAYLRNQKSQAALVDFLEELSDKYDVTYHLEPVRFEISTEGDPSKGGPETAPVTIVEFSDFECPYCSRVNPTLERVLDRFGEQVRLVFRQFPLEMHRHARKAAEASLCAFDQGKFWEMHDALFADRNALAVEQIKEKAEALGLDTEQFTECLDSGVKSAQIDEDIKAGLVAGVSGTPTVYVNGRPLPAGTSFQSIVDLVEEELAAK